MAERYYRLRCRKTGEFVCMDAQENFRATGDKAKADVFCEHVAPGAAFVASARHEADYRLVFAFRGDLCELDHGRVAASDAVRLPQPGSLFDVLRGLVA